MSSKEKKEKTPLLHITKRAEPGFLNKTAIRIAAVIVAMIFCMLLSWILIKINPAKMLSSMISGSFGSKRRLWKFFKDLSVLLCISLAVTPAFRMKFWNIGAEGQTLVGSLASVACIIWFGGKLPEPVLLIVMFIASIFMGALWGVIPAVCKALWGTNETLFTLMMNYIATNIVAYCLLLWTPSGSSVLGRLNYGFLPKIGHEYLLLIIVVVILTISLYIYLNYTKHGYEISVVGESERTALYIGINVKKVIVRTMTLSGSLCGLAGFLIVAALDHSVTTQTVGGAGFTAIMVSWLAKFDPVYMIVTSFLITFLDQGAAQISTDANIDNSFPSVIIGIIIFFIIGCEFFINYKINLRNKDRKEAK